MSAGRREENTMSGTIITASKATTAPKYNITAAGLLDAARNFYQDPENEAEFQEWIKSRKEGLNELVRYPGADHR